MPPPLLPKPPRTRLASALLVGSSLVWVAQAALIARAIGALAADASDISPVLPSVFWVCAGIFILGAARSALEAWGQRLLFLDARAHISQLREQVAKALLARSPLDKNRPASGLAASMMAEQAEALLPWLTRYRPAQWRTAVVPLVLLVIITPIAWPPALVLLCAAPLIPLFMALVGWRAKAASETHMVELGGLNAFLLDRLRGMTTLRAMHAVPVTLARLQDSGESLKTRTMAVLRIAFLSSAVLELFAALGVALVAVYIGFHLLGEVPFGAWGQRLTLTQGLFVLLLAPAFFEPLRELSAAWHDRASGQAALANLQQVLHPAQAQTVVAADAASAPVPTHTAADQAPIQTQALGVALQGVDFAHPDGAVVLRQFGCTIRPGERVALTGSSGAGKSVVLALMAGLAAPQRGQVLIGNTPLAPANAAALRQRIGWMGQKTHVFTGSVAGNITLHRPEVDAAQLHHALAQTGLHTLMQRLPAHTLGEGGSGFSGGEVVRLALARLAAAPHTGLLLADEPTAHLDADTAAHVRQTLLQLAHGKTLVVATHDPALMASMDRCIHLDAPATTTGEVQSSEVQGPEVQGPEVQGPEVQIPGGLPA